MEITLVTCHEGLLETLMKSPVAVAAAGLVVDIQWIGKCQEIQQTADHGSTTQPGTAQALQFEVNMSPACDSKACQVPICN